MSEQEDNHFVAHPEGGVTTVSQIEAEKAKAETTDVPSEVSAPEVVSDPTPEVATSPEEQPQEPSPAETTEAEPETTAPTEELVVGHLAENTDEQPEGNQAPATEPVAEETGNESE